MEHAQTLRDVLVEAVQQHGNRPAFQFVGDPDAITYDGVAALIQDVQRVLADAGVEPGDRVALYSENMPAWPVMYLAVTTYPAVVVPILPDFPPEDVANILQHAEVKLLLASPRLAEKLDSTEAAIPDVPRVDISNWNHSAGHELQGSHELQNGRELQDGSAVQDRHQPQNHRELQNGRQVPLQDRSKPDPEDLAAIIYTSGTTGLSKGVMLTHRNIVSNVMSASEIPLIKPGERMLSILPLSHTYECTLGFLVPFSHGASVAYFDRSPSPSSLLKALQSVRPHLMLSVPIFIEKIVRSRVFPELKKNRLLKTASSVPGVKRVLHRLAGKKLLKTFGGNLRFFGIGGAPLAPDVERFLRNARFPYSIGYGLTETAPLLAGTTPADTQFRSTGPAVSGVQIRIQNGEVQAKGPNVMRGYYRDPERTRETFTEDGWFRTGDLGTLGHDGYLFINGRSKNVIIGANGENIYPEAIESLINRIRFVADSLVIQVGTDIVARVQVNYDELQENLSNLRSAVNNNIRDARDAVGQLLEDLRKTVNQQISASARISRIVEQREPFEKTPTLKIKRYLYRTD